MGKRMLESLGYSVDIRTDGQSALQDIQEDPKKYDLLVTDQAMPKMLGTELIQLVREVNTSLKCIIITGFNESIPPDAKEKYNISHIVLKPLVLSEFSNLIGDVLHPSAKR
jgi:CheY-like chemotaxis protein